jgi:hypothetical protein
MSESVNCENRASQVRPGGAAELQHTTPRPARSTPASPVLKPETQIHADLVNRSLLVVGAVARTLLRIRRQKFPFDDQTRPKTCGVAESREYQARAVVGDDEVGVPATSCR